MKLYIKITFILVVLCAQAPLDLVIDTNERDVQINPGIAGTRVVLFGATPTGKRDIIIEIVGPPKNQTMQEKKKVFWIMAWPRKILL